MDEAYAFAVRRAGRRDGSVSHSPLRGGGTINKSDAPSLALSEFLVESRLLDEALEFTFVE